jgi:ammonia channel protein AmtB
VLDRLLGLRVTENEEEVGLDISEHGERAYA